MHCSARSSQWTVKIRRDFEKEKGSCTLEKMATTGEDYAIVSVCGVPGTLHVHKSRDNVPRHSQTQCHVHRVGDATVANGVLYGLSKTANATLPSLSAHELARGGGGAARRSATPEPLTAMTSTGAGGLVVGGSATGRVYVWHAETGVLLASGAALAHAVTALALSDDDDALLMAGADASVLVFRTTDVLRATDASATLRPLRTLVGHTLPVCAAALGFAGASARAVTAAGDRSLRVWHVASASCLATLLLPAAPRALALAPDEARAFAALADGSVAVVELASVPLESVASTDPAKGFAPIAPASGRGIGGVGALPPAATALALSPSGAELVVGYADGVVRVLDVASRTVLHAYAKHSTSAPVSVVFVLPALPLLGTSEKPIPSLAKALPVLNSDASTLQTRVLAPHALIDLSTRPPLEELTAIWVDRAIATAFPHGDTDPEPAVVDSQVLNVEAGNQPRRKRAVRDVVLSELVHEVNFLRRRNRELEQAGRKLTRLVESGTS